MPLISYNRQAARRYCELCREHNALPEGEDRRRVYERIKGFHEAYEIVCGSDSAVHALCYTADLQYERFGDATPYPLCWGVAPPDCVIPNPGKREGE